MTRVGSCLSFDFQVAHPEKSKKSCAFKGLHSFAKNIPNKQCDYARNDKTFWRFMPPNLPEQLLFL